MALSNKQLATLLQEIKSGNKKLDVVLATAKEKSTRGGGKRLGWLPAEKQAMKAGFMFRVNAAGQLVKLPDVDGRGFTLHVYYHNDTKKKK